MNIKRKISRGKLKNCKNVKRDSRNSDSTDKDQVSNEDEAFELTNKEDCEYIGVNIDVKLIKNNSEKENSSAVNANKFIRIGNNSVTVLQMLWKYINSIGVLAETTSNISIGTLLLLIKEIEHISKNRADEPIATVDINLIQKDSVETKSNEHNKSLKVYEYTHLAKITQFKRNNEGALNILHETSVQQLINTWEKLLADIVKWYYSNNTSKIPKERNLSYNKILQFSSLDEAKSYVIDDEVKQFLKETTKDQIKFIDEVFGINFKSSFKDFDILAELVQIRHLIVHCGGVITNEFISAVSGLKNRKFNELKTGEYINIHPSYIISSWSTVYVAGALLIHIITKKVFSDCYDIADNFLNSSAYVAIQMKQLSTAKILLEYAKGLHISKTKTKWIIIMNLAQTYKLLGEDDKFDELLASEDWDASNDLFQLCYASLKNMEDRFCIKLKDAARNKLISITELYEWPIFESIRKNENFNEWIEAAFGYTLNTPANLMDHKIIDCDPRRTMQIFDKYIKDEE